MSTDQLTRFAKTSAGFRVIDSRRPEAVLYCNRVLPKGKIMILEALKETEKYIWCNLINGPVIITDEEWKKYFKRI